MKKLTKAFIVIEILIFILIVLKLLLMFFDLHMLIELRFRFVFSLPFMLLCLTVVGLILGTLTIQKRWLKILFIVLCIMLCVIFILSLGIGIMFGNYRNSKTFIQVDIPSSDEIAILNPDGIVPTWAGNSTGLTCYVQINKALLKE